MDAIERHAERVRRVDPLVAGHDSLPQAGEGESVIEVPGAVGLAGVTRNDPDSLNAPWSPPVVYTLRPRVGDPEAFGPLLERWQEIVDADPGSRGPGRAMAVTWPSRDTVPVGALPRHGFAPTTAVAARPGGSAVPAGDLEARRAPGQARVRRAGPEDLDAMHPLYEELHAFDAQFGWLWAGPSTSMRLREHLAELLGLEEGWCWVAEEDGRLVGMLTVEPPSHSGWIASAVTADPVAYLGLCYIHPRARGRGIGAALAARAHATVDAAGVRVTLLHHAIANPLSAPFWARRGYRSLLTVWGKHLS
ncbi:GNAT family N-acetyltransferase [Thermoactinospora rubra]|uniref:GNAT family N-acetyltransferase n=1 Tax=Thermoactinospora rubra TaxID=1088767 RepID=UPI00117DD346|nr:GNAT family N-acetyltransferase [Thermoactinospora rubra]